jgi:microcystin-dependent protein
MDMSTNFLGAIMLFGGNFAPKGYALAQGQLMSIQQNTALFALFGTFYGGNGVTNFGLPDLRSRVALGQGNGQGLSPRVIGEIGGVETVTLLSANVPPHNHVFNATTTPSTTSGAGPTVLYGPAGSGENFYVPATGQGIQPTPLNLSTISNQGGNQPHNNIQPSMGLTITVALSGIFPTQG